MKETCKDELKKHKETCPFSECMCLDGCGKKMRLFEVNIWMNKLLIISFIETIA